MSRPDLIKKLKTKHPKLNKLQLESIIDTFFQSIEDSLKEKKSIFLRGFGTFSLHKHNSRTARNPKTGELVALQKRYTIHFKPSKELKTRVNNK